MLLKAVYDSKDLVPPQFAELYTERDGKFELTGVEGIKTQADVDRVQGALVNERNAHRTTQESLRGFTSVVGETDPSALQSIIDEHADLKARVDAGGGDPNPEQLESLVNARLPGLLRPVERERDALKQEIEQLRGQNGVLLGAHRNRLVRDAIAEATSGEKGIKVVPDALADIEMLANHVMDVDFDNENRVFVKDGAQGFSPGLSAKDWLADIQQKGNRRHWFEDSVGAGARPGGGGGGGGANPFDKKTFNLTECGQLVRQDPTRAIALAKAAGREDLVKNLMKK